MTNEGMVFTYAHTPSVEVIVFDILGREVISLVNEEKSAGYYEIKLDASNLPNGIYFYKIQANNFTQTKKMVLIK